MNKEQLMEENGLNMTAFGGTEQMYRGLFERLPLDLLEPFQIIPSRTNVELNLDKVRILWAHDFASDTMYDVLKNGGWNRYHKIVFVSNWQMQQFIELYKIPWSRCIVMNNCIDPIPATKKDDKIINLAYWSTPHRGLNILVPVFNKLCETHDNIRLHVFSSFKLYGWDGQDAQFAQIFNQMKQNPKIFNHGTVEHRELVETQLPEMHIMAYPSTYPETFCICLAEAMSAKILACHPNYGALPETAAHWTNMYQWDENINQHAAIFHMAMEASLQTCRNYLAENVLKGAKIHADLFYSWEKRISVWISLLEALKDMPVKLDVPSGPEFFEYHA